MGSVIIAVAILWIRNSRKDTITNTGLTVGQDVMSPLEQIPNITQRLNQQAAGTYNPNGSTASYTSYPGA